MLNVISIIIALLCVPAFFFGMLPLVGFLHWINMPFAAVGALLGAMSGKRTGLVMNLIVLVVGGARLACGGGVA